MQRSPRVSQHASAAGGFDAQPQTLLRVKALHNVGLGVSPRAPPPSIPSRLLLLLIFGGASVALVSFYAGQLTGCSPGAAPAPPQHAGARSAAPAIVSWRPPASGCREDYVSLIEERAEGGPKAGKNPPQLSLPQMLWIATAVRGAHAHGAPSEFLVFGLGYDSEIWSQVNCGGKTIFLENVQSWIKEVTSKVPGITVYPVTYNTLLEEPEAFFAAPTEPQLPPELESACFDVILVDSPMGWKEFDGQPGRYQPVYYAINNARRCIAEGRKPQVFIFVHDSHRKVEALLVKKYLSDPDTRRLGSIEGLWGRLDGVLVVPRGGEQQQERQQQQQEQQQEETEEKPRRSPRYEDDWRRRRV